MNTDCVILLHGLGRFRRSMKEIEKALIHFEFDVVNWSYPSLSCSITEVAIQLKEVVEINLQYHTKIHFITHSLGGIVVRRLLKLYEIENIASIVMIAPPNNASAVARVVMNNKFLKWFYGPAGQELKSKAYINEICANPKKNLMVIAGTKSYHIKNPTSHISWNILEKPNDGTVSVKETKLSKMDKFILVNDSHSKITSNPNVVKYTINFVKRHSSNKAKYHKPIYLKAISYIAHKPKLIDRILSDPDKYKNLLKTTLGGKLLWKDLASAKDLKIQQNLIFHNARIIDKNNNRIAMGSKKTMLKRFKKIVNDK